MDWIRKVGLQNLVIDMNIVGGKTNVVGDVFDVTNVGVVGVGDVGVVGGVDVYDVGNYNVDVNTVVDDVYGNVYNKGHVVGDLVRVFDVVGVNVVRVIETCKNGSLYVVGVQGVKTVEQQGVVSR
uniref:Uncharacterized protein n=1 Tax=Megaselia scalaris TaxID=36166 RepID=T1H4S3_MEGSC